MQTAEQILQALRKLGMQQQPLTRIYRSLYSQDLFLKAYGKIYRNHGALTVGTTQETADGMTLQRINTIIEQLRYERFYFTPARRTYLPKSNGKKRPLGIPAWSDKLVQEVLRLCLDAYYEPRFSDSSHGFRNQRGCHTALKHIKQKFVGTTWFIEGDIRGCFDNINHNTLMGILARDIQDGRLLELIRRSLKAGVMEDWQYKPTPSGTPQGGILSPLLANIYLNELDQFVTQTLIPEYTRGHLRKKNPAYRRIQHQMDMANKQGDTATRKQLYQIMRETPFGMPTDPNYRRLNYVRYADDFILGFIGPKAEAEEIKERIKQFLAERLQLALNDEKTLITHAKTQHAHFLGYAISVQQANDKLSRSANPKSKQRSVNGKIRLGIPQGRIDNYCQEYQQAGKVISNGSHTAYSDAHIIDFYQQRFRGIAEYYKFAADRGRLSKLRHVMQQALVKTLSQKYKVSVSQIFAKYRDTLNIDGQQYQILSVKVPTTQGERLIYWGGIPLRTLPIGSEPIRDTLGYQQGNSRSDLIQRLQADTCELCGVQGECEVHHIRKLADLKRRYAGRREKPEWVKCMIALRRKTLIVCKSCHQAIHAGNPTPNKRR